MKKEVEVKCSSCNRRQESICSRKKTWQVMVVALMEAKRQQTQPLKCEDVDCS